MEGCCRQVMCYSSIPPPWRDYRVLTSQHSHQISLGIIFLDNFKLCNITSSCSGSQPGTAHFSSSHSSCCPGDKATSLSSPQLCFRPSAGLGTSGSTGSKELVGTLKPSQTQHHCAAHKPQPWRGLNAHRASQNSEISLSHWALRAASSEVDIRRLLFDGFPTLHQRRSREGILTLSWIF